ncbi:MAG: hypothetical protein K8S55_15420 [Phycisphaerae bacterium]|nr:hypothetical protein [Phycisphaerae bacterium]
MADSSTGNPVPGVYTVLMIIAILALFISIGFSGHRLMGSPPAEGNKGGGFGMTFEQMFKPFDEVRAEMQADEGDAR